MKRFSQSDLVSSGAALNEVNSLRGTIFGTGIENLKYNSYFGILDNAMKGYTDYERVGYIFDADTVTHTDIDDVVSTIKDWFPNCLVSIQGKYFTVNGTERYFGTLKVKWDQAYA